MTKIGVRQPQAKEHMELPEATTDVQDGFCLRACRGHGPANTLISDFWPIELRE